MQPSSRTLSRLAAESHWILRYAQDDRSNDKVLKTCRSITDGKPHGLKALNMG
jgi:hypothetical protein